MDEAVRIQHEFVRLVANVVLYSHVVSQRLGLGPSDSQFMTLLSTHGPLTPGELAARSGLGSGTVTGVVDRLERAGLVRRSRDERDRRKVLVELEPGVVDERVLPLYAEQGESLARVLATRTPEELRVIADFLADANATAAPEG